MHTLETVSPAMLARRPGLDVLAAALTLPSGQSAEHLDLATERLAAFGLKRVRATLRGIGGDDRQVSPLGEHVVCRDGPHARDARVAQSS